MYDVYIVIDKKMKAWVICHAIYYFASCVLATSVLTFIYMCVCVCFPFHKSTILCREIGSELSRGSKGRLGDSQAQPKSCHLFIIEKDAETENGHQGEWLNKL